MLYALCSMLFLAACGFTPVYGHGPSESANPALASIYVSDIEGRSGQILRNRLNDLLNPENISAGQQYKLNIELKQDKREFGIQQDFRVTRYDLRITASYILVDTRTNNVVLKDHSVIYSDFNRTDSEFSTFVAEEDAAEKAAAQLAQEIKARLASYFQ